MYWYCSADSNFGTVFINVDLCDSNLEGWEVPQRKYNRPPQWEIVCGWGQHIWNVYIIEFWEKNKSGNFLKTPSRSASIMWKPYIDAAKTKLFKDFLSFILQKWSIGSVIMVIICSSVHRNHITIGAAIISACHFDVWNLKKCKKR